MLRAMRRRAATIAIAVVSVFATTGWADGPSVSETVQPSGPCAVPLARFCKDVPAGEGRLRSCLLAHERELPADCRARIAGTGKAAASPRAEPPMGPREADACRDDLAAHCAAVPSGSGRWLACLREHEAVIAPGCKAAIARNSAVRPPSPEAPAKRP